MTPTTVTLGCAGRPCATCSASPARKGLGITLPSLADIDVTDPKTWIIGALAVMLLYQLLFTGEKRKRRSTKRAAFKAERERFQAQMRKIRQSA